MFILKHPVAAAVSVRYIGSGGGTHHNVTAPVLYIHSSSKHSYSQ